MANAKWSEYNINKSGKCVLVCTLDRSTFRRACTRSVRAWHLKSRVQMDFFFFKWSLLLNLVHLTIWRVNAGLSVFLFFLRGFYFDESGMPCHERQSRFVMSHVFLVLVDSHSEWLETLQPQSPRRRSKASFPHMPDCQILSWLTMGQLSQGFQRVHEERRLPSRRRSTPPPCLEELSKMCC